jgi:hypothetical protein
MLYCKLPDGAWSPEPWLWAWNIALDRAVRLATEYHHECLGFSGPGGAEFQVIWFLKGTGAVGHVDTFLAFDPMLIAEYFYRRGLVFEYLRRGFFEGMVAGLHEKAYRAR